MKKATKFLLSLGTGITSVLAFPATVFAATVDNKISLGASGDFQQLNNITYITLISNGIKLLLVVAAVIFFFMLVIGGIQWIVAGGDKTGAENARKRITSALVGLAIVFVAWAIVSLINMLFGVNIFNLNVPTLYAP